MKNLQKNKKNKIKKVYFQFKPFSKKQRQVLTWWTDNSPVKDRDGIIADGAIRSGKSICMSLSYVVWAMTRFNGNNFGMCGKTIGSFRRNVLFWLKLMLQSRGYQVTDKRAENLMIVRKGDVENMFYLFGGKDERSQDLIQGITLAGCFFDEVALMPESFVNQATARCSVSGSKYWFNCNPDGPFHWFNKNWIKEIRNKNLLYLHFTMDDNLSLSEEIKDRYKRQYSGVFYDRYIRGLWKAAEGVIYDMFDYSKHVFKQVLDLMNQNEYRYISCDYGTQNAMVFLLWEMNRQGNWYCLEEYYYSGRELRKQKTDSEYADDLEKFLNGRKVNAIIVDPSAASFIAELRKRNYYVRKAKNDVEDGIRVVGNALNLGMIFIHESCDNTINEFYTYSWDPKKADSGIDTPIKANDHAMDAVRYFVYTVLGKRLEGGR